MTILYSVFESGVLRIREHVLNYVEIIERFTDDLAQDGTTVFCGVFHD